MIESLPRCAILAAVFTPAVVDVMIAEALKALAEAGAIVPEVTRVPGAFELPLIAQSLLQKSEVDALIVLGYIEKGETLHGEVMGHVVHTALVNLQLKYWKPVGIGIIGPGATLAQAEVRKVDCARAAVRAAIHNWTLLQKSDGAAF